MKINIKAANGKFVTAEYGGGIDTRIEWRIALYANRDEARGFETFDLVQNSDGSVSFQCYDPNYYISAELGGGSYLRTNATVIGPWEKFYIMENKFILCWNENNYVTAELGQGDDTRLVANRIIPGSWETFEFVGLHPPIKEPTREEIFTAQITFQGIEVNLPRFGGIIPWFEPFFASLNPEERQEIYKVKRNIKDKVINLAVSYEYTKHHGYTYFVQPGRDFYRDGLDLLNKLITEIKNEGFYIWLMMAGDGQGNGPEYNDPVGHTYGHNFLMNNLQRVLSATYENRKFIVYIPGYDGVFGPEKRLWAPEQVISYCRYIRSLIGDEGYAGFEFAAPYIHLGEGQSDYQNSRLDNMDLILLEHPYPFNQNGVWQPAARMLGRDYIRPKEQVGDNSPPFYLINGTPRGPFIVNSFEGRLYNFVRRQADVLDMNNDRLYRKSLGFKYIG